MNFNNLKKAGFHYFKNYTHIVIQKLTWYKILYVGF
jgi:hypothetical protein